MKINIFYSWQSTTDKAYNLHFIRRCVENAIKKIAKKPEFKGVSFHLEDGVRHSPGSPPVADTILGKTIPSYDIFICDLSVVNAVSGFHRLIRRLTRDKTKPFQNNNVINEHGVAYNALTPERIIGVLNASYGSPKSNPDNIPFDLAHLRFPIEYNYSLKTRDKEKVQKDLTDELANALKTTALFALSNRRTRHYPFHVWGEWKEKFPTDQQYVENPLILQLNQNILSAVNTPLQSVRILGLPGLGKTRILLELFRPAADNESSEILSSRVLYFSCNEHMHSYFQPMLDDISNENEDFIIILDNCPIETHRKVLPTFRRSGSKLSLITIDSNPEEMARDTISSVNYIVIKKEELSDVVDKILSTEYSGIGEENITRIKEFSQGIPLMAVLIADSIREGEKYIGKLTDKDLLNKLLGEKGKIEKNRIMLRSCALFNYFGFDEELQTQLAFIATNKNITSITGDDTVLINDFREVCTHYIKRQIFEKKGRLLGMRPLPLALSLAQEWLEPCTPERLAAVLQAIALLPSPDRGQLSEGLSEQMKYMGYDDNAKLIIEKLIAPGSPFDNAEVLNTELGSRFFRSFVEVNPTAVAANLARNLSVMTTEELKTIGEGRRNLVWVLEKLCFDKQTFTDGAKILCAFAVAENETWSNNATGQFVQLFHILLSGTEASLEMKWLVIEWGLHYRDSDFYALALRVMRAGLKYGHFTRTGSAHVQGSLVLVDNEPGWDEVRIYWQRILCKFAEIIKSGNEYAQFAIEAVENSVRGIYRAGLANLVLPVLTEIADFLHYDWDGGYAALKMALKYDAGATPEAIRSATNELAEKLTKRDFISKYTNLSNYFRLEKARYSEERVVEITLGLAEEFITKPASWTAWLTVIFQSAPSGAFYFGKHLYNLLEKEDEKIQSFIDDSLEALNGIEKNLRNPTVLGGFIAQASGAVKEQFYLRLYRHETLQYLLFYFISHDANGKKHFPLLYDLVSSGKSDIKGFNEFNYAIAVSALDENELTEFSETLFGLGPDGHTIVLEILFDIGYEDKTIKKNIVPILKKCIYQTGDSTTTINQWSLFKRKETICAIVRDPAETEFARFVNSNIIRSISFDNYMSQEDEFAEIYFELITVHFRTIWPDLSEALLSDDEDYKTYYFLKGVIGARIGDVFRPVGLLGFGDMEIIFKWCRANIQLAPARLAELLPIFAGNNDDYENWHPDTRKLIDEFGDAPNVLNHLSTNMGNYSWSNSVVPLLNAKRNLIKALVSHVNETVRIWANSHIIYIDKQLKEEINRDAEYG